jgi:hypothetical protein
LKNTPTNFSHKFKALQLTFQVVCISWRMSGRNTARTAVGGEFPALALSIGEVGA